MYPIDTWNIEAMFHEFRDTQPAPKPLIATVYGIPDKDTALGVAEAFKLSGLYLRVLVIHTTKTSRGAHWRRDVELDLHLHPQPVDEAKRLIEAA